MNPSSEGSGHGGGLSVDDDEQDLDHPCPFVFDPRFAKLSFVNIPGNSFTGLTPLWDAARVIEAVLTGPDKPGKEELRTANREQCRFLVQLDFSSNSFVEDITYSMTLFTQMCPSDELVYD